MKSEHFSRVILSSLVFFVAFGFGMRNGNAVQSSSMGKAFQQAQLEDEGRALLKQGLYSEALEKFREADDPGLKLQGYQDAVAKALIRETYQLQGAYEKALKELTPLLRVNPDQWNWKDEKYELEAMIESRDSKSTAPIYKFVNHMKDRYKADLPPQKYNSGVTVFIASSIIRCYDQIGDYDAGIFFMDEILSYWEKKSGQNLHRPGNKNQYFLIRQAFEQDKKEGRKGCMGQSGCVGRATKALVESDYFPW